MTKAKLLSEIENMCSWVKKADSCEIDDDKMIRNLIYKKVEQCSPLVKMAGFGEDKYSKEKLVSFVINVADFGGDDMKQLCRLVGEMTYFWEDNKECSFLAESGDDNMEKLYSFVGGIANSGTDDMKKLLVGIADSWKDKGSMNEEMMNNLLIVMAGLGKENKEKLYTLLEGMMDFFVGHIVKMYESLIGNENEDWKKVVLYIYLDRMTDFCKAQVGMAQYSKEAHHYLYISMNTLVQCWRDNNETVEEETMNSFLDDLKRLDTEKHYSLVKDFCQHHKEKLSTLLFGKGSIEKEKIMELYSLVDRMVEFCSRKKGNLYNLLVVVDDSLRKYNKEFIYKFLFYDMAGFGKDGKEIVYSLVVEMLDIWEHNNKEKFYSFLVRLGDPLEHLNRDKLVSFVYSIRDLWDYNLNKEKLDSLMFTVIDICLGEHGVEKQLQNLVVEMGGKDMIINKPRLYRWLSFSEHNRLLDILLDVGLHHNQTNESTSRILKEARTELSSIVDFLADKTLTLEEEKGSNLKYLIYQALEIALPVIQFQDSDPLVLLSQIFNGLQGFSNYIVLNGVVNEFSQNNLGKLRDLKDHILKFDFEGMTTEGLEEDIKLLLYSEGDMCVTSKAMLLPAIENMDKLLDKLVDLGETGFDKMLSKLMYMKMELCSPVVKMAGFGEDMHSKEKLVSFLVDVAAFGGDNMKQLCRFLGEMTSFLEDNKECSFLAESGDENMEKLYSFLVGIANSGTDETKKLLIGIADSWKDKGTVNEEIINSLLIVIASLGEDYKGNLYTWLVGMMDFSADHIVKMYKSLIGNEKVMLYVLLDRMAENCSQEDKLYRCLNDLVKCWKDNGETVKEEIMYSFLDYSKGSDKEKLYSLVKNFKEKLHRLLVGNKNENAEQVMLCILLDRMPEYYSEEEKLHRCLNDLVECWKDYHRNLRAEIMYRFLDDLKSDDKEELCSLVKGFCQHHKEQLYRLLIGNGSFDKEKEKKMKLYSLVDRMADFCKRKKNLLCFMLTRRGNYINELDVIHDMADVGEDNKEIVYSLVVEMLDIWEHNNKEKLYSFLVKLGDPLKHNNKEKLLSFLSGISGLWEGNKNKEKLHSLMVEVTDICFVERGDKKQLQNLVAEMAGNVMMINKVELYRWVAKWEHNLLLRMLLDHHIQTKESTYTRRRKMEQARNELRSIMYFLTDMTLRLEEVKRSSLYYLISEALEIAHLVIQFQDSDPLVLLSQIFNGLQIVNGVGELSDLEEHLRKFDFEGMTAESVGEFQTGEGGSNVVGLKEDIKLLLPSDEDMCALTYIRGMAGMGKTTLARELYNHPTVVRGFDCRAWVCVSSQLSRKDLLINLLQQLVDGKEIETDISSFHKMDNKSLIPMLHQQLQCMRCFIVLDDMTPYDSYMQNLFESLPKENGSILLATTRAPLPYLSPSDELALGDEACFNHKMEFMDDDKSWELLLKTLYFGGSDKRFPKQLEKKGRRALKKCNGLPLAIKEVGRRWAEMIGSGSKWEEVVESIDLSATLKALDRTYNSWSSKIQSCLWCLSFFREGATIKKQKLLYIWVLQGLNPDNFMSYLFTLSESYVIELKNMIHNKISMCRINPLFQTLSVNKALDAEGLEILNKDRKHPLSHKPRARVIYCSREKFDYSTRKDRHIVFLFFLGGGYFHTSSSYWNSFRVLEFLDMEDFGLKMLPDAIGTLSKLRYLGLRNNYIKELPPSLGQLKNLEVLDIAQNCMVEVPNVIWEIGTLWHLYMSGISCLDPLKIYELTNLETLSYISMYSWTYELSSLEQMRFLKKLGIEEVDENSDVSKLFVSLAKLRKLKSLVLRGFCFRRMPSLDKLGILQNLSTLKLDGLLTRLPSVSNFPPTISDLNLVNSCLDEDPMPILEKLPQLCSLKLQNAYTGQQMVISPHGFDNLLYLYIAELWHLRHIQVGEGAMSKLRELEINSCPYLETLPEETWPKELKMVTTKNIATKLRKSRLSSRMKKVEIQP